VPGSLHGRRAKPGMAPVERGDDDRCMASDATPGFENDRPQWLGSLVRRGERLAHDSTPAFEEEAGVRWLGSVARRNAEHDVAAQPRPASAPAPDEALTEWRGSSIRSAVFSTPPRIVSPADPLPASAPALHELNGHGRMVMGELGMALRVAA
jgi:hypothetical protein